MATQDLITLFTTCFGLLVGSFLNVVIYRVPREQSVVTPRSSCPHCGHMIKWYENIPVLSYTFLRGKCSKCRAGISLKYPLVELFVGVIAFNLAPSSVNSLELFKFIFYFSIACIFLCHFFIDLEFQILPDVLNLYLLAIVLPYVFFFYPLNFWLVGGIVGFFGPFLVTYLFYKLRGQIGLGGGDIKLYGILGLILGAVGVVKLIFFSCILGSVVGIILILTKKMNRETPLAFGPYIIVAAALQIFFPSILELIDPFKL